MTLGKSLLLGSAAAVVLGSGAQAADLPVRKAAPVDYVRVCDWTGAGYFYIPGTDTCLKIEGLIRVEGAFINNARQFYPTTTVGRPPASLPPARSSRAATRTRRASSPAAASPPTSARRPPTAPCAPTSATRSTASRASTQGGGSAGGANTFANQGGNNAYLDKGFIQFAGITAGRVQSFFDFYADNYNYEGIANSDFSNNVFAYTYTGAGGFSATFAVEDHNARNDGIGTVTGGQFGGRHVAVRRRDHPRPRRPAPRRPGLGCRSAERRLPSGQHRLGPFAGTNGQGFASKDATASPCRPAST